MSAQHPDAVVVGLWHLGLVTAAGLAAEGRSVVATDLDPGCVRAVRTGQLPIQEPRLQECLEQGIAGGRIQVLDFHEALALAEVVWITVDTPLASSGAADLRRLDAVVEAVAAGLREGATVLISSQVPLGTVRRYEERILRGGGGSVGYVPENLRLGSGLEDFHNQAQVICGGDDVIRSVVDRLMPGRTLLSCDVESAELSKHATNSCFAVTRRLRRRPGRSRALACCFHGGVLRVG